jgi:hypothetical protein
MKKVCLVFSLISSIFCELSAQKAVIETVKANVLYIGVDNPIDIAVPKVASEKLKVSIDNEAKIQKISKGHYYVRLTRDGEVTIMVEANGKTTKKTFQTKRIPDPIPMISGVGTGVGISEKSNLQNFIHGESLLAKLENFVFDARCSVQSFTVSIKPQNGEIYQTKVIGPVFSEDFKKRLLTLEVGDVVSFLGIKARCPGDSAARSLGDLTYTMK